MKKQLSLRGRRSQGLSWTPRSHSQGHQHPKRTSPLLRVHLLPFPPNVPVPGSQRRSTHHLRNPEPAFHRSSSPRAPPGLTWPLAKPSKPSYTANILCPSEMPTRTAARTAAFMPAAGAPTFTTPTLQLLCKSGGGAGHWLDAPPQAHAQVRGWRGDSGREVRLGGGGRDALEGRRVASTKQGPSRAGSRGEDRGQGLLPLGFRSPAA